MSLVTECACLDSIVVPASNQARWLETSLGSVLAQTHQTRERIVFTDGSTDDTEQKVRLIAISDSRGCLVNQATAGVLVARIRFLRKWRVSFVALLHALLVRRDAIKRTRATWNPDFYSYQGWGFWPRLMVHHPTAAAPPDVTTIYKVRGTSATENRYRGWREYVSLVAYRNAL